MYGGLGGPFPCRLGCALTFLRQDYRLRHEHSLVHEPEKRFPCTIPQCSIRFTRKDTLDAHLASYNHDQPSVDESGIVFIGEERRFMCHYPGCGRHYSRAGKRARHQSKEHPSFVQTARKIGKQGSGTHFCTATDCNSKFTTKSSLTRHVRDAHSGPKERLSCPFPPCAITFGTNNNLQAHIKSYHSDKAKPSAIKSTTPAKKK
ncbi:hypothetical protein BJ508DRAFT_213657 [Ascobolus immersus RN42]|uniref:C2H2-type domain-containing protein n=1 Tax=Ascobolus immersus RN42 TaxID=1160509 RepID=A0A3N4I3H1_ASCIM|nr:hypothetical protein BJ508DRAFT_213657 [Ascobolus immersus RN42]